MSILDRAVLLALAGLPIAVPIATHANSVKCADVEAVAGCKERDHIEQIEPTSPHEDSAPETGGSVTFYPAPGAISIEGLAPDARRSRVFNYPENLGTPLVLLRSIE